jgi:hypothetical protein
MSVVTIQDWQALSFFAVDPVPADADVPWPYNDYLYEITRGNLSLSFSLAPAYKDVRCVLKNQGNKVYELNAVGVEDVKYSETKDAEMLEVIVSKRESILFRVNPTIVIEQVVRNEI